MRSALLTANGVFRLSRRDCEFYSIMITSSGSWIAILITDGKGRPLFHQPSAFTGSFVLGGEAEGGLIVHLHGSDPPQVTINYREPDQELV